MKYFFVFLILMSGFILSEDLQVTQSFPFDSYLLAYWSFDNCTATDDSGNGHNGKLNGNPTCVNGKIGKALKFDGNDDDIEIPAINQNISLTVAAWVNATSIDKSSYHTVIFERQSDGYDACGYYSSGNFGMQFFEGKFSFEAATVNSSGTCELKRVKYGSPTTNTWYCMVGTYDKSTGKLRLYVDGNLLAEDTGYTNLRTITDPIIRIGMNSPWAYPNGQRWNGILDEIRVYSKALTQQEIQQLCQSGSGGCNGQLTVSSIASSPGSQNVIQPVNISYQGSPCATQAQFDISYNSNYLSLSGVETGSASSSAGKSCSYNTLGTGSARIVCAGQNQNVIGSGELVRLKWNISSNAPQGQSTTVGCSNAIGSDASGNSFNLSCSSGTVTFSSGNCCDLNSDGSVNVGDLQTLVNVILGKQSCPK